MSLETDLAESPALRAQDAVARSSPWLALAVVWVCIVAMALVFRGLSPILPLLIADLRLGHAEAGLLTSLFSMPGILVSIPAGLLADRYDSGRLAAGSLALAVGASVVVALGDSFAVLAVARVVAGIGGAAIYVIGARFVSRWFVGRGQARAIGIYSTALPVGSILALNTMGTVGERWGWRGAVLVEAAVCLGALLLFATLRPPDARAKPAPHKQAERPLEAIARIGLPVWLIGCIWACFNGAIGSFLTFGPDYFVSLGAGLFFAGFLTSFVMLLSPPVAPLVGHLLDRYGREPAFIAAGGLLVGVSILAMYGSSAAPLPALVVLGLGNALVPAAILSITPRTMAPRYFGTGYGIAVTCLNVGVFLGPYVTGLARDLTGSYQASFYVMGSLALAVPFLAAALAFTLRRRAPSARPS
ncbi:MAG: MFS transporter [Chloroflexota bacterium]